MDGKDVEKNALTSSTEELSICQKLRANSLYNVCSPFLLLMRLGGAFFLSTSAATRAPSDRCYFNRSLTSRRTKPRICTRVEWLEIFFKSYCCFALFWLLLYAGRFFIGLVSTLPSQSLSSGTDLAIILAKMSYGVWFLNIIAVQLIFLRACWKEGLFYQLFMKWEIWRYTSANSQCKAFSERFLPRRNIVTIVAVLLLIPEFMTVWIPCFAGGEYAEHYRRKLFAGFDPHNKLILAIAVIGHFFASFVYIVPVFLFVLIALAIENEFARLNYDLSKSITEDGRIESGLIEMYRLKHGKLCDFVELGDRIFSFFCLITIGVGVFEIFSLVFVLGVLSGLEERYFGAILVQAYWFLLYVLQPGSILWAGMKVNEAAHSPLSKLYRLDQTKISSQEVLCLQSFIGRLTTTRLGFTAWRMFTIDATALLSLLGLYVTYQLLLFQVQMELSSPGTPTNASSSLNLTLIK